MSCFCAIEQALALTSQFGSRVKPAGRQSVKVCNNIGTEGLLSAGGTSLSLLDT